MVQRNQEARQRRLQERQRQAAASQIQAFYRRCTGRRLVVILCSVLATASPPGAVCGLCMELCCRFANRNAIMTHAHHNPIATQLEELRSQFDAMAAESVCRVSQIKDQTRRLVLFFRPQTDRARVNVLCNAWLTAGEGTPSIDDSASDQSTLYGTKNTLLQQMVVIASSVLLDPTTETPRVQDFLFEFGRQRRWPAGKMAERDVASLTNNGEFRAAWISNMLSCVQAASCPTILICSPVRKYGFGGGCRVH